MNRSTSLYLDIVRLSAALLVLFSHLSFQNISGQLEFLSAAGLPAVDVFFVLSGFVIAYVFATRENKAKAYFTNRAVRIYSVAIPAVILTALLDSLGQSDTGPFQAFGPGVIVRSVLFLGEQWNVHRFPGSNGPYWSLGFEVWYYIAFGVFAFIPKWRWFATACVLLFIGPKVAILFPVWLMGMATYHVCARNRLSRTTGWILLLAPIGVLTGYYAVVPHVYVSVPQFMNLDLSLLRVWGVGQDYLIGSLFAIHLIGFSTVSRSFDWIQRYARPIRWTAGATFTIYLMHLPIMTLLAAVSPWPQSSPWTLVFLVSATLAACFLFAEVSERRKEIWKHGAMMTWKAVTGMVPGHRRLNS